MTQRRKPPRKALTAPRGHHGSALGVPRTHDVTQAHTHGLHDMCGVHLVAATARGLMRPTSSPRKHEAWCGLPLPHAGTRAPKSCAVSQLMKPWAQCHGLMAPSNSWLASRCLRKAQGAMPCAPRGISHGRNAMARCLEAGKQATSPSHRHLDMARAHTPVWERLTNAPDTWSDGWCTLPDSEGLDQRHADGHSVTRGTLRRRRQLVRGTLQKLGGQGLRRWQCS